MATLTLHRKTELRDVFLREGEELTLRLPGRAAHLAGRYVWRLDEIELPRGASPLDYARATVSHDAFVEGQTAQLIPVKATRGRVRIGFACYPIGSTMPVCRQVFHLKVR